MRTPTSVYNESLALLTDLYQLTMAYGYWKAGMADREAVFDLYFRKKPFGGGFGLACGLADVMDLLEHFRFNEQDIEYLGTLRGNDEAPLFEPAFLAYLSTLHFTCDVDAIPEGTVVFPQEPLLRLSGPIIQGQILETPLLNGINFQSLIATKAARVCLATRGDPVLEFGLRRAHGIDGALAASRAAYVGGCAATSNVLAGKLYDIPVRGTHAHSWVMCFDDEMESFKTYARVMPNNCVFLVDTYDTLVGVERAIEVGRWLRSEGHRMGGVRLDSGDLAYLSIKAREMLDGAGFEDAVIVGSNDLDEHIITSLKQQGAKIGVWGVGTKLCTAYDQPALGGVYKLAALRESSGAWKYKLKLSEQAIKVSTPGIHQVRRFYSRGQMIADAIYDLELGIRGDCTIVDPKDMTRRKMVAADTEHMDLLVPIFRGGRRVYDLPPIHASRDLALVEVGKLHEGIKRFVNPHEYPVGLELALHELKTDLILEARGLK